MICTRAELAVISETDCFEEDGEFLVLEVPLIALLMIASRRYYFLNSVREPGPDHGFHCFCRSDS